MQTMLKAQKTIEDIEADVSNILTPETLERMRSTFFHDILDSPLIDKQYLIQLERAVIQHSVSKNSESPPPLKTPICTLNHSVNGAMFV